MLIMATKSRIYSNTIVFRSLYHFNYVQFYNGIADRPNHELCLVVVIKFLTVLGFGIELSGMVFVAQEAVSATLATCPSAESTLGK